MKLTIELNTANLTNAQLRALALLTTGSEADEPIRAGGTSSEEVDPNVFQPKDIAASLPLLRSQVVLKVGDSVGLRDGDSYTVTHASRNSTYPVILTSGICYRLNGLCYTDSEINPDAYDITTLNGRPIVEDGL